MDSGELLALACRLLDYDPDTGVLTWSQQAAFKVRGKRAGCATRLGRTQIRLGERTVLAHHLAFAMLHGTWPTRVAFADGDPSNLRPTNLRACTIQELAWNAHKSETRPTTSRFKGVYRSRHTNKWRAQICIDGRARHLGQFDDEEAASAAYARAAQQLAGELARAF